MQHLASSPPKARSRQQSADVAHARHSLPHIAIFRCIGHNNLLDILSGRIDVSVRGGSDSSPPQLIGRPTTLCAYSHMAICA